jgi:hypothetical protein
VSTLTIELNDAGILARAGSGVIIESPGCALIDRKTLLTGRAAAERARLEPRKVNNRFWSELDTSALPRPFPATMSHADLAHAHLAAVWGEAGGGAESVVLAIPGSTSEHQLGLTLGIARACGMPVEGMIDAAVAAGSGEGAAERVLHLDVQLHRVVLTVLARGAELVRQSVQVSGHTGITMLHDSWARSVAGAFVQQARFDPLHVAAAEQELYLRLPGLLEQLGGAERVVFEMEASGKRHAVELARGQAVAAVEPSYEGIVQLVRRVKRAGEPAELLLSHRVAGLPGLTERLAEIGESELRELPPDAALAGAERHRDAIRAPGEALPFVTRLALHAAPAPARREPALAPLPPPGPATRSDSSPSPTHLLFEGRAYPIGDEPLVLGVAVDPGKRGLSLAGTSPGISREHCSVQRRGERCVVEDHSTYGSFLNGQQVSGSAELAVGDRLRVGSPGVELLLIAVVEADGTPR